MKRSKILILFIIFVAVFGHFLKLVIDAGLFSSLEKVSLKNCVLETGLQGAEDIEKMGPYLFISSNWHQPLFKDPNQSGALFYKNLESEKQETVKLEVDLPRSFKPHGIEVFRIDDKTIRLFVVNHSNQGDFIEIFDFVDEKLNLIKSLSHPDLFNANDIGALDGDRFFVSIDHGYQSHLGKLFEDLSRFGRGYLMAYDGKKFKKLNGHYAFPNGIEIVGDQILVALMLERSILSATIEVNSMSLIGIEKNFIGFGPDNINWDSDRGKLYAGTHPKVLNLLLHSKDAKKNSPSQVLEINIHNNYESKVFYSNEGKPLSAISVGLFYGDHFYMGSIYNDGIIKCSTKIEGEPE